MMRSLIRNEMNYYARQPLCWLALLLAPAFALLASISGMGAGQQLLKQIVLTQSALLMLVLPLFIGAMAPLAFLREHQYQMEEMLGALPLTARQWCVSRAAGLCLLGFLAMGLVQLAVMAGVWWRQSAVLSGADWLGIGKTMLQTSVLQTIPAVLWLSLLMLWCSLKSSKSTLIYVLTCVIYLAYPMLAVATGSPLMANGKMLSPALWQVMNVLDPYAVTPIAGQWVQGVSSLAHVIQLDSALLINRMSLAGLCAFLLWRSLRLAETRVGLAVEREARPSGRALSQTVKEDEKSGSAYSGAYFSVATQAGWSLTLVRLVKLMLSQILRQRSTYFSLVLLLIFMTTEVLGGLDYVERYAVLVPTSLDALNRIMWDFVPMVGVLLLVLWSSRLSWHNQAHGMDELVAATPVTSALYLSAHLISLCLLSLLWLTLALAAPALAQIMSGSAIEVLVYARQAGYTLLPLLVWSLVLIACHALMRTQVQALGLIALLLALRFSPLPGMLGLEHPLWQWLQTPLRMPDMLWGYQASAAAFMPFMWFWLWLSALLFVLALMAYHRGTGFSRDGFAWRMLWQKPRAYYAVAALILIAGAALQGTSLHQTLRAESGVLSGQERQAQRAEYEKKYQHWQNQAPMTVLKVTTEIAFHLQRGDATTTEKNSAQISANVLLQNQTSQAISQVLLGQLDSPRANSLRLQGASVLAHDARLGQTTFQFDPPLPAGQTAQLQVKMSLQQSDLQSAKMHQTLRPDWSYVRMLTLLPVLGFVPELRLKDAETRARWHLPPLAELRPSRLFADASKINGRYDWAQWESTVSVPVGMQVVAQGNLLRQWQADQRQYFHFQTSQAIRNLGAFAVLPWQPKTWQQDGVPLLVYSPEQNAATTLTAGAMQDTMHWFHQHIGRYPGDALRLLMMPELERGSSAYALPQIILVNHRYGLRALPSEQAGFNQVYRRTVHETAHQWFGHGIGNGIAEDGAFLVESLVKYVELVLIEKKYGTAGMQALVELEEERFRFAQARSRALNKALVDADESHDLYSRATLVFARLRQELGDEVICQALRHVWEQHRYPKSPASSMDFVRALLAISPPQQHAMIRHLLLDADISVFLLGKE